MASANPITQIGKYEILSELGRGGMGVVYRAEDKFIGREVAIKTLTDATPELRQRFLVEARSGVLNHQNIVTVYDFGEQDGNPYIVMEFLRGESLERILKSGRPLSLVEKLDIVRQVCEGLGYAHQKGVVHRDVKPANVMVQPDGHVKIVDFGIARLESAAGHTVAGAVIGTFHYISPERLKGDHSDGRADIWACGVMLYLLLTGRLPFAGEEVSALHKVVNEAYEPLSNFLIDYPPALDGILSRALAKDPDERYATAEEMAAEIESVNENLKRTRVGEVLVQVKDLLGQEQLTSVRPMLLDLQKLDPQNTEVKRLLREVQDKLSRQQKHEQLRQIVQQAEDAAREHRYSEALDIYKQAGKLDPTNAGLTSKIHQIRELKEKADKVEALKSQAREARHRNDFTAAAKFIGDAMTLDVDNTDLRNEQARILQEQDRLSKEETRRKLKETGRENLAGRQFTQAIKILRDALELDPTDPDTQKMYQDAVAKQEDDRLRRIIDQIVNEIQDQIFRGQLDRALELINRALERLPGEGVLIRLKAETQKQNAEAQAKKLVDETSMRVQTLFFTAPQEALTAVQSALETLPSDERLLALQDRVTEQIKKVRIEGLRANYLKQAQTALDERRFADAIQVLETALLDCGQTPELQSLLEHARSEKRTVEVRTAAAASMREAQTLLASGDVERAIAVLQKSSQETSDPALTQLLRQTREQSEEVTRHVDAVIQRIRELGDTDPVQALQLLQAQPETIQQHPQMKALRADLDAKHERSQAVAAAIAQSSEQLQQGQLREGLATLEAVGQAYGESPEIQSATAEYRQRRSALANAQLQQCMAGARQAVLAQDSERALQMLQGANAAVEFGDPALQVEWKRLSADVNKAVATKRRSSMPAPSAKPPLLTTNMLIAIGVVLLVIAAGVFFALRPKPPAVTTFVQFNAAPYAEVVSMTPAKGDALTLPAGDHSTPLRLESVPLATYSVVFRGPDGSTHTEPCILTKDNHLCSSTFAELTDVDITAIVAGDKP